jgi:hypothetical protein
MLDVTFGTEGSALTSAKPTASVSARRVGSFVDGTIFILPFSLGDAFD